MTFLKAGTILLKLQLLINMFIRGRYWGQLVIGWLDNHHLLEIENHTQSYARTLSARGIHIYPGNTFFSVSWDLRVKYLFFQGLGPSLDKDQYPARSMRLLETPAIALSLRAAVFSSFRKKSHHSHPSFTLLLYLSHRFREKSQWKKQKHRLSITRQMWTLPQVLSTHLRDKAGHLAPKHRKRDGDADFQEGKDQYHSLKCPLKRNRCHKERGKKGRNIINRWSFCRPWIIWFQSDSSSTLEIGTFFLITNQKRKIDKKILKWLRGVLLRISISAGKFRLNQMYFLSFFWFRNSLCCLLQVFFLITTPLYEFMLFSHLKIREPPGLGKGHQCPFLLHSTPRSFWASWLGALPLLPTTTPCKWHWAHWASTAACCHLNLNLETL